MASEIFNDGPVTPQRLHALVRLVPRLQNPSRQDLYDSLQPADLSNNQKTAASVFNAAVDCALISEDVERGKVVRLTVPRERFDEPTAFRLHMQEVLCGVAREGQSNYLLNLYAAWYASQDERIFGFGRTEYESRFNEQLFPGYEERPFNTTKLPSWRTWASYLGWGWLMGIGPNRSQTLVPNAYERLRPQLSRLVTTQDGDLAFAAFVDRIAQACPELDGGVLFERCRQADPEGDSRRNNLSLMLSTGLRGLHDVGLIELIRKPDASMWRLYPAEGQPINEVSHVRRIGM